MNIKRFLAPTSREALAKARMAFGDGTLILSNRPTPQGVEVVATAEDMLSALAPADEAVATAPAGAAPVAARVEPQAASTAPLPSSLRTDKTTAPAAAAGKSPVQADTEQLAMSTLSFQDYVRERMLRRRHAALHGMTEPVLDAAETFAVPAAEASAAAVPAAHTAQAARPVPAAPVNIAAAAPVRVQASASTSQRSEPAPPQAARPILAQAAAPAVAARSATAAGPARSRELPAHDGAGAVFGQPSPSAGITGELVAMRQLIEERFNTLTWLGQARQDPIQSNLILKLIRAGYSPTLARSVLEHLPAELAPAQAVRWLVDVLERNLKTDSGSPSLVEDGGVYALVGPTGIGKTTTAAKLAARCVRQHGPHSVGLITLDTYRIAAHEQLRAYGRMLGVVAHLAHDRAALQDLLSLLAGKKMVLIDTTGVAPRDPRKREVLDALDLPQVQRLLVLNACSHGDALDDALASFRTGTVQQAVLSKVDEAVKLGPALDCIVRNQLLLRGVTNGQRVPEDWESADPTRLVRQSLRAPVKSAFDPKLLDLNFFFSPAQAGGTETVDA